MDQILVGGIRDDADDFGAGRRVGRVVVNVIVDISLMDLGVIVEPVIANVTPCACRRLRHDDVGPFRCQ
jgi:hypothetical protein